MFTAWVVGVDVVLNDGGPNHTSRCAHESQSDLPDRSESDALLAEPGIDEQIADRDEHDQGDRIKLSDDLGRYASVLHSVGLRGEVVVELIVADPVERVPQEDRASFEPTS